MSWRRLTGKKVGNDIVKIVEQVIANEKDSRLKVCIGTDSQAHGGLFDFATAIVFLREGKGGLVLIRNFTSERAFTLKERMIKEVAESVQVAYELCSVFERFNIEFEVHADINADPLFRSNVAFKEAMGYIRGMGFAFKAKPEAFASTYCANKAVK